VGGSGYIGSRIIERYHHRFRFINLSRRYPNKMAVNNILCDTSCGIDFLEFDCQIDCIIHCAEIDQNQCGRGDYYDFAKGVSQVLDFAKKQNIERFIHFSALCSDYETPYTKTKLLTERMVETAQVPYVVFKLAPVFGGNSPFDRTVERLAKLIALPKGDGEKYFIPIHIDDLFSNIDYILENQKVWNKTYTLCGPDRLRLYEILERISHRRRLEVPKNLQKALFKMSFDEEMHFFYRRLITHDQSLIEYCESHLLAPKNRY